MNEQVLHIGLSQIVVTVSSFAVLFLSVLFGLLKYFFTKDARSIEERFNSLSEAVEDIKTQLTDEVRLLERRVQQVELEIVKHYVPKLEHDAAINRIHTRMDEILALLKSRI